MPAYATKLPMRFHGGEYLLTRARTCAYCGAAGNLTNEHLFPQFLYERTYERSGTVVLTNVSGKTEKAVSSEPTIRDVCTVCNSGVLAVLDGYVSELYGRLFQTIVQPGQRIKFDFDFDNLLRWLLKIAYNTARARRWPVSQLAELRNYVLGRQNRPPGAHVLLQLVIPTKVERGSIEGHPDVTEIEPLLNRVIRLDVRQLPGLAQAFTVSLNSYYFHVPLEDLNVDAHVRRRVVKRFLKMVPGAYELSRTGRAVIYASSLDIMKAISGVRPFERNLGLGKKWLEESGGYSTRRRT